LEPQFEGNNEEQHLEKDFEDETKLSESEIEEQQNPEQSGKNILKSFFKYNDKTVTSYIFHLQLDALAYYGFFIIQEKRFENFFNTRRCQISGRRRRISGKQRRIPAGRI
jgi:hypothetical protein